MLAFVHYWNSFVEPLLYIRTDDKMTASMGLRVLYQLDRTNWSLIMTGAVMPEVIAAARLLHDEGVAATVLSIVIPAVRAAVVPAAAALRLARDREAHGRAEERVAVGVVGRAVERVGEPHEP